MSKKTRKVRKNNKNNKTKYRGGSKGKGKGKGKGKISLFENTVKALASLRTNLIPMDLVVGNDGVVRVDQGKVNLFSQVVHVHIR